MPGLRTIDLDSLPPADAETLLLNIALRIGSYAAQLAKLCGGLPMALRLAGSALAEREDREPDEYIRRLDDAQTRLELIEASLALSDQLLLPELPRLWRLLAVFPADFDRPVVARI